MADYNYKYYEKESANAFVTADETADYERAQLFLLDIIARSLARIADVLEKTHGLSEPKEDDYDLGLVKAEDDDNS